MESPSLAREEEGTIQVPLPSRERLGEGAR
jgi:hypothetical protein